MAKERASITGAKWAEVKAEMRGIMIDCARARQTITYSELTRMLQTAYVHYHSHILTRLLIEIGTEEASEGRPVLPAVVVTRQTGMPGGGFFSIDTGEDEISDPVGYWKDLLQATYDYWSEH